MPNSMETNPSDPTDNFVQPDWNTKYGTGVAPENDATNDFDTIYQAQRDEAQARADAQAAG